MNFKAILTTLMLLLVLISTSQEKSKFGYLVCVTDVKFDVKCKDVLLIDTAQDICDNYFPGKINVENDLKYDNFISIMTDNRGFYIEKKNVVIKKSGKVKLRKIRK